MSPLEIRRYQITEEDFGLIQANLQAYILHYLETKGAAFDACKGCSLSYLELSDDGSLQCQCYNPNEPIDPMVPYQHIPDRYCNSYKQGGDGTCEGSRPFDNVWRICVNAGLDKCIGVMWNSCQGPTSDTTVNGAWKLMMPGQDVGSFIDGSGHWDIFLP